MQNHTFFFFMRTTFIGKKIKKERTLGEKKEGCKVVLEV